MAFCERMGVQFFFFGALGDLKFQNHTLFSIILIWPKTGVCLQVQATPLSSLRELFTPKGPSSPKAILA